MINAQDFENEIMYHANVLKRRNQNFLRPEEQIELETMSYANVLS
jgi:hypothetical protein